MEVTDALVKAGDLRWGERLGVETITDAEMQLRGECLTDGDFVNRAWIRRPALNDSWAIYFAAERGIHRGDLREIRHTRKVEEYASPDPDADHAGDMTDRPELRGRCSAASDPRQRQIRRATRSNKTLQRRTTPARPRNRREHNAAHHPNQQHHSHDSARRSPHFTPRHHRDRTHDQAIRDSRAARPSSSRLRDDAPTAIPAITTRLHAPNSRSTRRKTPTRRWCPPPPRPPAPASTKQPSHPSHPSVRAPGGLQARRIRTWPKRGVGNFRTSTHAALAWRSKTRAPRCFRSEVPEIALGGSVVNSGGSTTTYVPQPERGRATSTLRTSLGPCR